MALLQNHLAGGWKEVVVSQSDDGRTTAGVKASAEQVEKPEEELPEKEDICLLAIYRQGRERAERYQAAKERMDAMLFPRKKKSAMPQKASFPWLFVCL